MRSKSSFILKLGVSLSLLISLCSCMTAYIKSVGGQPDPRFQRIYLSEREIVWQSVLEALKSFPIDISNKESGVIQTKWKDNTSDSNLSDNFGGNPVYLKAQFRYRINVTTGSYQGRPAIKVSVRKEQVVNQDALDGWKKVSSNGVEEKTLLYRLGRIVYMKMVLAHEEEKKIQAEIQESKEDMQADFDFSKEESKSKKSDSMNEETDDLEKEFEVDDFDDEDFTPLE